MAIDPTIATLFAIIAVVVVGLLFAGDMLSTLIDAASPAQDLLEMHTRLVDGGESAHKTTINKYMSLQPQVGMGRGSAAFVYVADPGGEDESFVPNEKIRETGCTANCLCTGRLLPYGDVKLAALTGCANMRARGIQEVRLLITSDWNDYWEESCKNDGGYSKSNWAVPMCFIEADDIPRVRNYTVEITECPDMDDCIQYEFAWGIE